VGATISWTAAAVSGRTIVKYGDRVVRYVYIAAAQPACQIMGVSKGCYCRCDFASEGLSSVHRVTESLGRMEFRCNYF